MPRKLKVFRTMTGFHDAYVAAPSRAAALRAWGASTDLFAMDAAEEVTDPKLMEEPLSKPGEVIRQSRGSDAEHVAAAGPVTKAQAKAKASPAPSLNHDPAVPVSRKPRSGSRRPRLFALRRSKRSSMREPRFVSVRKRHVARSTRSGANWPPRGRSRSTPTRLH
jgi:hypothetical protein